MPMTEEFLRRHEQERRWDVAYQVGSSLILFALLLAVTFLAVQHDEFIQKYECKIEQCEERNGNGKQ